MSCQLSPHHTIGRGGGNGIAVDAKDSISGNGISQHHRISGHNSTDAILNGGRSRIKTGRISEIGIVAQSRSNTLVQHLTGKFAFSHTDFIIASSTQTHETRRHLLIIVTVRHSTCLRITSHIAHILYAINLTTGDAISRRIRVSRILFLITHNTTHIAITCNTASINISID